MKYIKKFSNHNSYELFKLGRKFVKPNLSLCIEEDEVHYTQYIKPYYKFGDILYENIYGGTKITSNILDPSEGYIPIGLCLAPTEFFGIGEKARFMSLKYMSCTTPETGSLAEQGICWGNSGVIIETLKKISKTYKNGTTWGYNTADWISGTQNKIPSLFDLNNEWNISVLGTVNGYAVTDIDGKNNTNNILATATLQSDWRTASTIDNVGNRNYAPAACCCWRYHTLSTQQGDWYLGGGGEITILLPKRNEINTKLAAINTIYPNDCISSLSNNEYWTSTEYNDNNGNLTYNINTNDGGIGGNAKNSNKYVIAMLQY